MSLLSRFHFLQKPLRYESKVWFALWGIQITIFISVGELSDMIGSVLFQYVNIEMFYRKATLFGYDFPLMLLFSEVLMGAYIIYLAIKVTDLEEFFTKLKFIGTYLCCTLIARLIFVYNQQTINNYNDLYVILKGLWILFCFVYYSCIQNTKID